MAIAPDHGTERLDPSRQRLINAIVFFAQNAKAVGKIKLFKLIYLLDFEHFRQTGQSVTGMDFYAWKFGPVPTSLMEEWECGFQPDLRNAIHIQPVQVVDYVRQQVVPNEGVEFDDSYFSPRQIGIMTELVTQYGETYSPEMIDVTHAQNGAWDRVWMGGQGSYDPIPYELALAHDDEHRQEILEAAEEVAAFNRAFG